ncbi:MAG TPA: TetR/AcrR family transcriptional regulator [Syntrophorhabdaceae bacterium]|nr:TetR/AcrR family transcriptional regulator [Syntrophorhabdaceae bacterium]
MKKKILDAAFNLFCTNGFHRTTTNEIARQAGVSIGSLYSYFKDKEMILLEILDRYHEQFVLLRERSMSMLNIGSLDEKKWLRGLIQGIIAIHENSKEFNRELRALYYSNADVAKVINEQNNETIKEVKKYLRRWNKKLKSSEVDTVAIIALDFIAALVDRIVFGDNSIKKERILKAGVEGLYKILSLK